MNLNRYLLFVVLWMLSFTLLIAQAADSVRGQVVDENGRPLDGVKWRISGIEELHDGKWTLVIYSGLSREGTTYEEIEVKR